MGDVGIDFASFEFRISRVFGFGDFEVVGLVRIGVYCV